MSLWQSLHCQYRIKNKKKKRSLKDHQENKIKNVHNTSEFFLSIMMLILGQDCCCVRQKLNSCQNIQPALYVRELHALWVSYSEAIPLFAHPLTLAIHKTPCILSFLLSPCLFRECITFQGQNTRRFVNGRGREKGVVPITALISAVLEV